MTENEQSWYIVEGKKEPNDPIYSVAIYYWWIELA